MFKNATPYRLIESLNIDSVSLNEKLSQCPAKDCSNQQIQTCGWIGPLGIYGNDGDYMVTVSPSVFFLRLRVHERLLPPSVINEHVATKVEQIEIEEERRVGRKERSQIKEQVFSELLPKAFCQSTYIDGYIDTRHNLIVIDAPSRNKAELFLSCLRKTIGTLRVQPIVTRLSISTILTNIVSGHFALYGGISSNGDYSLEGAENDKKAKLKNYSLSAEELLKHLKNGMLVTEMSFNSSIGLSFTFNENFIIKSIKSEIMLEDSSGPASAFIVDGIMTSGTLSDLINIFIDMCGGEADQTTNDNQEAA